MINWTGLWVTVSLIANFYAVHIHDTPLIVVSAVCIALSGFFYFGERG